MYQLVQKLEDILNSGHPEIRTWFLVRHSYWPFILCGFYVLFTVYIGPAIMKNRKPYDLRKPMIAFNFFVVAVYIITLIVILGCVPYITREQFCKGADVKFGEPVYIIVRTCWVIYLLRYIEFLDTVFFILRKKDSLITFLHVMHHAVVPVLGWIMFRSERSGFQVILVVNNSIVHIVMYSYYGLAAMGPHVRKYLWWKKYLTMLQMSQFIFIIIFVTIITPLSGCSLVQTTYLIDALFGPLFLYLFYRFYKNTFLDKKKSPVANGTAQEKSVKNASSVGNAITNGHDKKEIALNGKAKKNE